ncbi:aspartate carbamoyltransferase catalytic subunit [Holdemania filiformis]|uniref:aspartate carbamoyltransferase catalytic subunit n=1 Tax=Holdemania filiformis TaxID=61171 RepID=UPI00267492B9|nr:aspartate carbamoyltransferase catalytic subunit [Holdemania filiformis]
MNSLFQLSSLSVDEIQHLLDVAEQCRQGRFIDSEKGKIVANLFFEPSTRTQYSFNTAEEKLGMKVINFNAQASSMQKGETFYDTVKTFESFGIDAVVIRDRQDEYYKQLQGRINIPILNAGDGKKDHPTQSLLDLMTIRQEFGHFDGLKIAIVGDVKYSRVAHTNIEVMQRLGMRCFISGPEEYRDPQYDYIDFDQAVKDMDVIMLLRVQHERHEQAMSLTQEEYHARYGLTLERVKAMKDTAIIMHPAPFNRGVEIADEVVECRKSRIFKQINNGVFVRMAVLKRAMEGR